MIKKEANGCNVDHKNNGSKIKRTRGVRGGKGTRSVWKEATRHSSAGSV